MLHFVRVPRPAASSFTSLRRAHTRLIGAALKGFLQKLGWSMASSKYQVVSSRAFASLVDFTQWSGAALAEEGVWMGMKGKHPADEIAALPATVSVFHVEQLVVPGLDAERCIVWMRKLLGA